MTVTVRYFAAVREQLGGSESIDWSATPARNVGALREWLQTLSPAHAAALDEAKGLRMARDQTLCAADEPLADGDEVAFFPPVTGG